LGSVGGTIEEKDEMGGKKSVKLQYSKVLIILLCSGYLVALKYDNGL
jgi:hypothetical protein